jgi:hypothetical protein
MVDKAGGIKPGTVQPQQIIQQQQGPKSLQDKEAQQVKDQNQKARISSADAARIASQAGFQRLKKKSDKGIDIGDSSGAPIPLPNDEIEDDAWSQERLDKAQENLTLATAQFGEVARGTEEATLGASIVGSSFMPTEDDLAKMQAIAGKAGQDPQPIMDEVSNSVGRLFGIELPEETPMGHKVLAAGLVVAGEQESVQVDKGKLDEKELAEGIEKVTKRGNQAVEEAQKMSKGINKELSVQRTFVFKR